MAEHMAETESCVRDKDEEQQRTNEATGEVCSQEPGAERKASEEARVNRFKLLEKVIQKSLEKFTDLAR